MAVLQKNSSRAKKKVFIVDDHPIVRQGLAQLINQQSDLIVCGEGSDVTHSKKSISKCKPDLAIVDLSLGNSSGLRLIEDLAHEFPSLNVMTLSMHDESIYGERCLKAGAKGYIMKQETPENVMQAIRKVLQGEIYVSQNLQKLLLGKLITDKSEVYRSPISRLSNRELEIFQLIGQGMKNKIIAKNLNLSSKTVETHIEHIKSKLNFSDFRELHTYAVRWAMSEQID